MTFTSPSDMFAFGALAPSVIVHAALAMIIINCPFGNAQNSINYSCYAPWQDWLFRNGPLFVCLWVASIFYWAFIVFWNIGPWPG